MHILDSEFLNNADNKSVFLDINIQIDKSIWKETPKRG